MDPHIETSPPEVHKLEITLNRKVILSTSIFKKPETAEDLKAVLLDVIKGLPLKAVPASKNEYK